MVDTMQRISAVLAGVALGAALVVVVLRLLASSKPSAAAWGRRVTRARGAGTFAVSTVATLGSLYFSESAGYVPCRLCWFQRIAMYPIAIVALIGVLRRDRAARWYALALASIGAAVSSYHVAIEQGWLNDSETCALFGPSCADVWFEAFGFVTLAWMALAGFLAIIVFNTVSFDSVGAADTATTVDREQP